MPIATPVPPAHPTNMVAAPTAHSRIGSGAGVRPEVAEAAEAAEVAEEEAIECASSPCALAEFADWARPAAARPPETTP